MFLFWLIVGRYLPVRLATVFRLLTAVALEQAVQDYRTIAGRRNRLLRRSPLSPIGRGLGAQAESTRVSSLGERHFASVNSDPTVAAAISGGSSMAATTRLLLQPIFRYSITSPTASMCRRRRWRGGVEHVDVPHGFSLFFVLPFLVTS